jgi:hypothetical protein
MYESTTAAGKSNVPFINIPSSAINITILFNGVTKPGLTNDLLVQLGVGVTPTYQVTGYTSRCTYEISTVTSSTVGFTLNPINQSITSTSGFTGIMNLILTTANTLSSANTWLSNFKGVVSYGASSVYITEAIGYVTLTGPLTAIRVVASYAQSPSEQFSGGSVTINKYTN